MSKGKVMLTYDDHLPAIVELMFTEDDQLPGKVEVMSTFAIHSEDEHFDENR